MYEIPTSDLPVAPVLFEPGPSRRRFLQGAAVALGASAVLPSWLADRAAGATPLGANEGRLVVVTLRGGNDSMNTVTPVSGLLRTLYDTLRGTLALNGSSLLPAAGGMGFHPKLPKLKASYDAGRVALIQGVGDPATDLSHFVSTATLMAGTSGSDRTTGWLGRYLDELDGWDTGKAALAVAPTVPLHVVGKRTKVLTVPGGGGQWGGSAVAAERIAEDALRAFAAAPTGLGPWADQVAKISSDALDLATSVNGLYAPALPAAPFTRDMTLAARMLNANAGTRVITVEQQGWDTHALQADRHAAQLAMLDDALSAFFGSLRKDLWSTVTVLVVSEFGRRARANSSLGTDHGGAGLAMVIGENVRGGMYGEHPSLSLLDPAGSLVPTVDFRSVYATVLERWMGADPREVLGGSYEQLDVFAAAPGAPRPALTATAA